jgi:hypothetical protein
MIGNGRLSEAAIPAYKPFMALAGNFLPANKCGFALYEYLRQNHFMPS